MIQVRFVFDPAMPPEHYATIDEAIAATGADDLNDLPWRDNGDHVTIFLGDGLIELDVPYNIIH